MKLVKFYDEHEQFMYNGWIYEVVHKYDYWCLCRKMYDGTAHLIDLNEEIDEDE